MSTQIQTICSIVLFSFAGTALRAGIVAVTWPQGILYSALFAQLIGCASMGMLVSARKFFPARYTYAFVLALIVFWLKVNYTT